MSLSLKLSDNNYDAMVYLGVKNNIIVSIKFLYMQMCSHTLQVAFGSDFSRMVSDEDMGLKNVKGSGTFGFLISHSLKGSQASFRNPCYHVKLIYYK